MPDPEHSLTDAATAQEAFTTFRHAADIIAEHVHAALADHRLTVSQFAVLEALYHLGPQCQKDLARNISKSSGNLTMVTDNLEKRGLVVRRRRKKDRRYLEIALSAKGKTRIGAIIPAHAARITAVMAPLSAAEQQQLTLLCRKIKQLSATIEEEGTPPSSYAITRPRKVYDD